MTPADDFTREILAMLRASRPAFSFHAAEPLEIKGASDTGDQFRLSLKRLHAACVREPETAERFRSEFLAAFQAAFAPEPPAQVDRQRIIPILRSPEYFDRLMEELARHEPGEAPHGPARALMNERLAVAFAEDDPRALRFLREDELESMGLSFEDGLALAITNLARLTPQMRFQPVGEFYMVTAGGRYEASLILERQTWESRQIEVKGDYVFGIPRQDVLFVTGSEDAEGLARMDEMMRAAVESTDAVISSDLFVLQEGGRIVVFDR
ncbi:MAG: DUF1444 family protein [Planctomycetota bacterium]|nr:MAG: DUF1444 family protein [Planctomycetota bacterium]